ncbi:MAG TPA: hypothetical protein VKU39_16180, partial [Streptosporangiaceae bacterium]|nr:hypothetical protein [Streptosporangiaceae bacterium]
MTDVRDSSTELPGQQPRQGDGEFPVRRSSQSGEGSFPVRPNAARFVQPGGRHRRPLPASLPEGSPALVLAVPATQDDAINGVAKEIAMIIGLDNPALDVQLAKIGEGNGDPDGIRSVLSDAAARRPAGAPSSIVVPLLVTPHPPVVRAIQEAIQVTGVNALVSEVFNTNSVLAETLHIRLADAGLARADRVRKFSITTSADGIVVAAIGGAAGLSSANVTSVLLCARLALVAQPAVLDGQPSIEEQAARLQQMGV